MDALRTSNFSRNVQSAFNAFSIAAVCSVEVSLYKYNKRSSGVKLVIGKPDLSGKRCVFCPKNVNRPEYKRGRPSLIVRELLILSVIGLFRYDEQVLVITLHQ